MMNLKWINTGRFYKCYTDNTGHILGAVRESDDGDGTFTAIIRGHFAGDYVTQDAAVVAIEKTLNSVYKELDDSTK